MWWIPEPLDHLPGPPSSIIVAKLRPSSHISLPPHPQYLPGSRLQAFIRVNLVFTGGIRPKTSARYLPSASTIFKRCLYFGDNMIGLCMVRVDIP